MTQTLRLDAPGEDGPGAVVRWLAPLASAAGVLLATVAVTVAADHPRTVRHAPPPDVEQTVAVYIPPQLALTPCRGGQIRVEAPDDCRP